MKLAYSEERTVMHDMDPITKFLWVCIINLVLFASRDLRDVLLISAISFLTAVFLGKISLIRYLKFSLLLLSGGTFIILYQAYFQEGPGVTVMGINLSYNGFLLGLAIASRSLGIVSAALAFSRTTSPREVYLALVRMKVPYKISRMLYISLRFIPVFEKDLNDIRSVQKMRGIAKGMRSGVSALIILVGVAFRRVDEIAIALDTRAFGMYKTRTELETLKITAGGVILLVSTSISLLVIRL